jgi:hypothetical protein
VKELASSSFPDPGPAQHAGAHSGLTHPAGGPLNPPPSASSGQDQGQAPAVVGPLVSRPVDDTDPLHKIGAGRYEIVDANGVRIVHRLVGVNSAAAIAHILNEGLERYGICVRHLQENRRDGSCFSCILGVSPSPYAVAR